MHRSICLLNEQGDTTISWAEDQDEAMQGYIQSKMDAGVVFYMVPPRGPRGGQPKPKKLTDPAKANQGRSLLVKDEQLSKLIFEGKVRADIKLDAPKPSTGRATSARQAASGHSLGVQQRHGG